MDDIVLDEDNIDPQEVAQSNSERQSAFMTPQPAETP